MVENKKGKVDNRFKTIETSYGEYQIKVPSGKIGAKQMAMFMKLSPKSKERDDDGNPILSPADEARISDGFLEWTESIMPEVVISSPFESIEDIPGEDQMILFLSVWQSVNNTNSFR